MNTVRELEHVKPAVTAKALILNHPKPFFKRRGFLLVLAALVLLTVLRETGVVNLSFSHDDFEGSYSRTGDIRELNAKRVIIEPDDGKPFLPKIKRPDDSYLYTVRYRITSSLSPWRWVPLYKFGGNKAQITYQVWGEGTPLDFGAINAEKTLTMQGFASARDYEKAVTNPLIDQMIRRVKEKVPADVPITIR